MRPKNLRSILREASGGLFLTPDWETFPLMPEPSGIITMIGFPDLEEPPWLEYPPKSSRGMMCRVAGKVCWQTAEIWTELCQKVPGHAFRSNSLHTPRRLLLPGYHWPAGRSPAYREMGPDAPELPKGIQARAVHTADPVRCCIIAWLT